MVPTMTVSYALQTAPLALGKWSLPFASPFTHPQYPPPSLEKLLDGFNEIRRTGGGPDLPVVSGLHRGMHRLAKALVDFHNLTDRLAEARKASTDKPHVNLSILAPIWRQAERMVCRHPRPEEGVIASCLMGLEQGALLVSGEFIPLLAVGHPVPLGCQVLFSAFSSGPEGGFLITSETYVVSHELELERRVGPGCGVERRLRIRREPPESAAIVFTPTLPQSDGMIEIVAKGREPKAMTIARWVDKRPDARDDGAAAIAADYRLLRAALTPWT